MFTDIRLALRLLRRDWGFTLLSTLTLAIGIGAATAMFSIVDAVLLRPLPYSEADRLVGFDDVQERGERTPADYPEYADWKANAPPAFAEIGGWFDAGATITGDGDPESLVGDRISANIPAMLGVRPILGRSFRADEESPTSDRVVMLSERFWERRYNADPAITGKVVTLGGRPYTVVGIFPSTARALLPTELGSTRRPDFWMPLRLDETVAPRGLHFMFVMGRLRPGASVEAASSQIAGVATRLTRDSVTTHGVAIMPLAERIVGDASMLLKVLLGAVLMLLLIACANVANLLLARGVHRRREFAIRLALGARRARIVSQLLAENLARALFGGALGVGIAYAAIAAARRWLALGDLPRSEQIALDGRVLVVALFASVVTGVVFGLVPALRGVSGDSAASLRDAGRGVFGRMGGARLRRTLIVGEIAMSFVLLVGAGLLIRSFAALASVDKGFDDARVLATVIALPSSRYPDSTSQRLFFRRLLDDVTALPGVERAALASNLPIEGGVDGGIIIEGQTFPTGEGPMAEKRVVSGNYLAFMGANVIEGRLFDANDIPGASVPVVVVNETFAKKWFPGESAVGKRMQFSWGTADTQTVAGVIRDLREGPQNQPAVGAVYIPLEQRSNDAMYLVVRGSADPMALVPAIRTRLAEIDPLMPLVGVRTLSDVVAAGISRQRATTTILTTFAGIALLLAAVGLYGVISYSVTQRRQELGIRAALGARPAVLLRLVLGQGAAFLAVGTVLGFAGALALGRYISAQLFEVQPTDMKTYVAVAAVLGAAALVATVVPALRATRVDPVTALRAE